MDRDLAGGRPGAQLKLGVTKITSRWACLLGHLTWPQPATVPAGDVITRQVNARRALAFNPDGGVSLGQSP